MMQIRLWLQTARRAGHAQPNCELWTRRVGVALVVSCVAGVLFLRGSAAPPQSCSLLPPVLSFGIDHHDGHDAGAVAPARSTYERNGLASLRFWLPLNGAPTGTHIRVRSQLSDIALPPPTV
jgi:hypothetical protein